MSCLGSRITSNTTTLMVARTEQRTAALVRPRAAHVAAGITLIDMHLGLGLALRLVGFCRPHHTENKGLDFGDSLFTKFCQHRTEFRGIQERVEYINLNGSVNAKCTERRPRKSHGRWRGSTLSPLQGRRQKRRMDKEVAWSMSRGTFLG